MNQQQRELAVARQTLNSYGIAATPAAAMHVISDFDRLPVDAVPDEATIRRVRAAAIVRFYADDTGGRVSVSR